MPVAPKWAGRVSKWKIARIYEDHASGFNDEELLHDVAFTLLMCCKSMLMVEEARSGRTTCPVCDAILGNEAKKGAVLACENCDWAGSWDEYRRSFDGKHLIAPGL